MNPSRSGQSSTSRSAHPLVVTGILVGCLGLLAVVWAASPVIDAATGAVTDSLGTLVDWKLPAWVGKLILAAVLLGISGLLLLIGGGRWLLGALASARNRRTGPGAQAQLTDGRPAASDHQFAAHQEYAPPQQTQPHQTPALPKDYQPYAPTQPLIQPPSPDQPY